MKNKLSGSIEEMRNHFNEVLAADKNFDIIDRRMLIGGREAVLYFVDGMMKDETFQKLLQFLGGIKSDEMPQDEETFYKSFIPYGEVDIVSDEQQIITSILSGVPCLFIDGFQAAFAIDARTYPMRSVDEPDKDKVMRGSKDGFVETVVFNTALIRRRIRNPEFRTEILSAGKSSRTDIVLCYMESKVNTKVLDKIRKKISEIKVDALSMNQESLAECLYRRVWINPFPKFKYTERPDAAAASILEGSLVVLVDNSPAAMIIPCSIFDIIEEANDYYFPPITGTYLRLSRFLINFLALFLTPVFLLLMDNPDFIPKSLEFIVIQDEMNIPLIWQFLILEFAVDGLKLASLNTPSMLSTPLSVVAALIIGEFTVSSGWFNAEAMLYMAFVTLANYTQVSFELGYALKFMRILNLILTSIFGWWGFAAGCLITIASIVFNRTIGGGSYIAPIIPFSGKQLLRRFFRVSLPTSEK